MRCKSLPGVVVEQYVKRAVDSREETGISRNVVQFWQNACSLWEHEAAGSSPVIPTDRKAAIFWTQNECD